MTMLLTKFKVAATALLTIGTLLAGVAVLARQATAPSRKRHVEPEALTSPLKEPSSDAHQPTLRAGGYLFTASPTGNKAIAYDPTTREVKSVELNATKEHPLKITPLTGDHVQLVALRIQGAKITRVAVFDLESGKWLPMDLAEPVKGDVKPVYLGHGGTAYDLGRNVYTYNAKAKQWDHRDITTFADDDEGAANVPAPGRARK
jgi:hypothetical protein